MSKADVEKIEMSQDRNELEIRIAPERVADLEHIGKKISKASGGGPVGEFTILRRSIDARGKNPVYLLRISLGKPEFESGGPLKDALKPVAVSAKKALVVGAGPAGYFGALALLENGIGPVVLERGRDVDSRRRDIASLLKKSLVDPDSNYCFGEGGAGTFSDGKLYTRSKKRGDIRKILRYFVEHGADPDILVDARPHIGSNRLPGIVRRIRETILDRGGEIHFNAKVVDLIVEGGKCKGVVTQDGDEFLADAVILATGHSAHGIFEMLHRRNIALEMKSFAMGVRVEHPQELIDKIRYGSNKHRRHLPASSYSVAARIDGRGVYSFCMCPGGYVIPASTYSGELVLNGMSMSSRSAPLANAGIVVEVGPDDIPGGHGGEPLALLQFQRDLEKAVFLAGGGDAQKAPAQRMTDFCEQRESENLPKSSYLPGVVSRPLHELLPEFIVGRLQKAFRQFDRNLRGFYTRDALLLAVESRTSSPVKIPRDPATLMHPQIQNLFPCGEGGGHAGGIVSSALDGVRAAERVAAAVGK